MTMMRFCWKMNCLRQNEIGSSDAVQSGHRSKTTQTILMRLNRTEIDEE